MATGTDRLRFDLPADIIIWDAGTGEAIQQVRQAHAGSIISLAWSPNGRWLSSGGGDQMIKLWNANWVQPSVLLGHEGDVYAVAWSPDGKTLYSGGADATVRIWDPESGRQLMTLRGHSAPVRAISVSPNGRYIASASRDQTIKIWHATVSPVFRALSPVVAPLDHGQPAQPADQQALLLAGCSRAAWSPDGRQIVAEELTGDVVRDLVVFDAQSGEELLRIPGACFGPLTSVAWSPPDGRFLAAVSEGDGRLKAWEVATRGELLNVAAHIPEARSVSWNPDGTLLATCGRDRTVKVWKLGLISPLHTFSEMSHEVGSVVWSPNGRSLAVACHDQTIVVLDAETGKERLRVGQDPGWRYGPGGQHSVAWNPEGDRLAAGFSQGTMLIRDIATGQEMSIRGHTSNVRSVAWSPDGRRLASGSEDRTVKIWDAQSGDELLTLRGHESEVLSVAWSPSGQQLLAASRLSVTVWDASRGYDSVDR
jgi:WD40 repeat protein